jgi:hypothetical protein
MDLRKPVMGNPYGGSADWYSAAAAKSVLFSDQIINSPREISWSDSYNYGIDRQIR